MKILTIGHTLALAFIILSSCMAKRKAGLVTFLKHAEPEPKTFCTTLKTKIKDNVISVKARIENSDKEQNFMFDTGAPLTYTFKTKDSFNIAAKKLLRFGPAKFEYGSGSIALGNVTFNNAGYLVTDYILDDYEGIDGLIGSSLLQTSICELNFADSTIKISNDLGNFTNIQNCYAGSFEPYEGQGTPVVNMIFGKDTTTAFIDTGFDGLVKLSQQEFIPPEAAAKRGSVRNSRYFGGQNKDLFIYRTYYQVYHLAFLGLTLDSTVLMQYNEYKGRNLIGMGFLKKFIVTIDWIHHRIYLKPIEELAFKKNIYSYGFTCWRQNGELRVLEVYKDSDIEKAGVKSGDVIVSINKIKDVPELLISRINTNQPGKDTVLIELKNKPALSLTKKKVFD